MSNKTDIKGWFTASELAGLAGLPGSVQGVIGRAKREGWDSRKRAGRGGGREYPITALPKDARIQLLGQSAQQGQNLPAVRSETLPSTTAGTMATAIAAAPVQDLDDLRTWQVKRMDARIGLMNLIGTDPNGVGAGIDNLVKQANDGTLPPLYAKFVTLANARAGKEGKRTLSRTTLYRWWNTWNTSGRTVTSLAPAKTVKNDVPAWAPHFLKIYQVPQGVSVPRALEELARTLPEGIDLPSLSQVRRFMKKYSRLEIQKGRKSASSLAAVRLYRQRDVSEFQPLDMVQIDGHSFKAYVAHPRHGRPFHPECCAVVDTVTKCALGFSVGLAESAITVADAIRHATVLNKDKMIGGLPLFVYADKGAGNMAKVNIDEVSGLFARLQIEFMSGRPGNPQARGLVENLNKLLWIPAAQKLPTYTGKGMDSLAKRNIYLDLQTEVRRAKKENRAFDHAALISWPDFMEFLAAEVDAYNRRPHGSLPKITDPNSGYRRHMAPMEAWMKWLADGWRPEQLTEQEIEHLFRPHTTVKTTRGMVRLWGNVYTDPLLEHHHGDEVMVGYDIHDSSFVNVRTLDGERITTAKRDGNKSSFASVPLVDKKRLDRRDNRLKNVDARREEIELEAEALISINPVAPKQIELDAIEIERSDAIIKRVEQKKQTQIFENPWDRYLNILGKKQDASTYEKSWLADYEQYTETGKRKGLFKADEFCLAEERKRAALEKEKALQQQG
ncbi:MAG: DNA-binding protein [Desulfuromonadaceae bacterium]|nr:DNA-binding protein [Desulfuromonadaceae bacterium]